MSEPVLRFLSTRHSTPSRLLTAPGPDPDQLHTLLTLACRVPDHGRLGAWRFLLIEGEARVALGQLLVARTRELNPDAAANVLDKEAARFSQAPLVIGVIACPVLGHKVPESEQRSAAAAVAHQLLLAAQALGLGAQWLTGWAAYDPVITRHLGLGATESVIGFVHVGTPSEVVPERERPSLEARVSRWSAPT